MTSHPIRLIFWAPILWMVLFLGDGYINNRIMLDQMHFDKCIYAAQQEKFARPLYSYWCKCPSLWLVVPSTSEALDGSFGFGFFQHPEGEQPLGERWCQSWERSRLESRLSFEGDCSAEKEGSGDSFENSLREEERGFSSLLTFGLEVVWLALGLVSSSEISGLGGNEATITSSSCSMAPIT